MNRFYVLIFLFTSIFSFKNSNAQIPVAVEEIPGNLVFKLKPEYKTAAAGNTISLEKLNQTLALVKATNLTQKFPKAVLPGDNPEAVDLTLIYQINISPEMNTGKICQTLLQTGFISYAEPLRSYPPLYMPNDPFADSATSTFQFHLNRIRAYRGWDFDKGDTSIVIGILDTGVRYNHKDPIGNLKYNYADPIDGIDNDKDGYLDNYRGWDVGDNDNNASADVDGHGVFVTGVSSASTDNGKGVAGVGFKCKYLPIKIYRSLILGSFSGFEGIVYAADHGCSVINLSWGGAATPSAFEQEVIDYAVINKNVVVIGAAGNTNAKLDFYPASYKNVISVGSLKASGQKGSAHTFSYRIDLSAPGENIRTTGNASDSAYTNNVSGSSFAAPQISGAAGLVKHKFPQLNAQQIGQLLRVTADPKIYQLPANASYIDKLGKGILDIAKALSTTNAKSVRYTDVTLNQGEKLYPNDTIDLAVSFKNYLNPLSNLSVTLSSPSAFVTILQPNFAAGAMATLAAKTTTQPFQILIHTNIPVNERVALKFQFTDGTYSDYQYYEVIVNPDFVTLDINKLAVTINSLGNIGYNQGNYTQGNGVQYKNMNLLAPGSGFMAGSSAKRVSDNVFKSVVSSGIVLDNDFVKLVAARKITATPYADQEIKAEMKDLFPDTTMAGVKVNYRAFAWENAPRDKFVILEYKISNNQSAAINNLYAGIFADWDIFDSGKNQAKWDAANKMGYVFNVDDDTLYAGIKLLTSGLPSYYALDLYSPPAGTINIVDGFTDAEKYQALSGGIGRATAGSAAFGNDIAHVVGSALPNLAPNDSIIVAFALLAGDNLVQLQTTAGAAQTAYTQMVSGYNKDLTGRKGNLSIFPNPASQNVTIILPQNQEVYSVEIKNMAGQQIAAYGRQKGNQLNIGLEHFPAGLYLVQVKTESLTYSRKIQVVK